METDFPEFSTSSPVPRKSASKTSCSGNLALGISCIAVTLSIAAYVQMANEPSSTVYAEPQQGIGQRRVEPDLPTFPSPVDSFVNAQNADIDTGIWPPKGEFLGGEPLISSLNSRDVTDQRTLKDSHRFELIRDPNGPGYIKHGYACEYELYVKYGYYWFGQRAGPWHEELYIRKGDGTELKSNAKTIWYWKDEQVTEQEWNDHLTQLQSTFK